MKLKGDKKKTTTATTSLTWFCCCCCWFCLLILLDFFLSHIIGFDPFLLLKIHCPFSGEPHRFPQHWSHPCCERYENLVHCWTSHRKSAENQHGVTFTCDSEKLHDAYWQPDVDCDKASFKTARCFMPLIWLSGHTLCKVWPTLKDWLALKGKLCCAMCSWPSTRKM